MVKVFLRPGRDARARGGHPWVFRGEIARTNGRPAPGDVVEVRDSRSQLIGTGFWNAASQISVRLWSGTAEVLDDKLLEARLEQAIQRREPLLTGTDAVRLVHAEGDAMPGLIVDRYADVIVVQSLSLGVETRLPVLARLLEQKLKPKVIYARGDSGVRKLEGLPLESRAIRGDPGAPCPVEIQERGVRFLVDWKAGQKTGFFLDQRDNRAVLAGIVADMVKERPAAPDVLDLFCHTGAFSVVAAHAGAAAAFGIDSSADALRLAKDNAERNGVSGKTGFQKGEVFDELRVLSRARRRYDVVVLDPPAFAKSKTQIAGAMRGYADVNRLALRLVRPGGYLLTFSCSQHLSVGAFLETLQHAATEAPAKVRLVRLLYQATDHPMLLHVPETLYLKGALVQAL